jgi:hypothetical protein
VELIGITSHDLISSLIKGSRKTLLRSDGDSFIALPIIIFFGMDSVGWFSSGARLKSQYPKILSLDIVLLIHEDGASHTHCIQ